ncbi:hypothetical protein GCM10023350_29740 [Nocardioides endophyticus]|uniref:Sec-independent protein translocase protein TatA n=1 Tax=Nocardioides endophyticus TaxID=1353775 RepID=A0ABP8YYF6_9ACTN
MAVLVLLFGATKLPELAQGSGRALRIFKAETKGLMDDDGSSAGSVDAASVDATDVLGTGTRSTIARDD